MMLRYRNLSRYPTVFRVMTGLKVNEFDDLLDEVMPRFGGAERQRLSWTGRRRAIGGGPAFELSPLDQVLLTLVWLRRYPTHETLGFLFGVSDSTVGRYLRRVLPLLEQVGQAAMRLPQPSKKRGRQLDDLLHDTPELAVVIDAFEQRVQRPTERGEADSYYSGKKKTHTLKSQVAVDDYTGHIVEVSASVQGRVHDLTLLRQSGLLGRLPPGVGALADAAYRGLERDHPQGLAATPRRKPRGQPRPAADVAYNAAFARRRVVVEHTLARLRRYEALTQIDRQHRRDHSARVAAVAGLVNLQIRSRFVH